MIKISKSKNDECKLYSNKDLINLNFGILESPLIRMEADVDSSLFLPRLINIHEQKLIENQNYLKYSHHSLETKVCLKNIKKYQNILKHLKTAQNLIKSH